MAREAVLIFELEPPIPFTISGLVGIDKGSIMALSDPMTVAKAGAEQTMAGGIAASEKIAADRITKLGIYRRGIFKGSISGSCTAGDPLTSGGDNYLMAVADITTISGSPIYGYTFEDATDNQTILFELNIGGRVGAQ